MSADETGIEDQPAVEETRNWPELVTECTTGSMR